MKTIFEELWNGHMMPYNSCGKNDPEIVALLDLISKNRANLERESDTQQRALFKKYEACQEEYIYLMMVHAFREGICFSGKLLAEIFTDDR